MKPLILITLIVLVSGCAVAPVSTATVEPTTARTATMMPTDPPTPTPSPTSLSARLPTRSPEPNVDFVDLTDFVSAWNSHNQATIRALYLEGARYFTDSEMQKLKNKEPFEVLVSDNQFLGQIQKFDGLTMRILGEPIGINGKLVAFAYRWENADKAGHDAAALLRYEGDKILLHVDMVSPQQTIGDVGNLNYATTASLDDLMKTWNKGDMALGEQLYADNAVILSDEDLMQASWRDFIHPPQLKQVLAEFSGWNPTVLTDPIRVGDLVIFAFRWNLIGVTYPASFGVRLLRYEGSSIATDIRYGIRPWEKSGKPFLTP